jgi:hypothetical protein
MNVAVDEMGAADQKKGTLDGMQRLHKRCLNTAFIAATRYILAGMPVGTNQNFGFFSKNIQLAGIGD